MSSIGKPRCEAQIPRSGGYTVRCKKKAAKLVNQLDGAYKFAKYCKEHQKQR